MALYQPFPMEEGAGAQAWQYAPAYRRPRHFHHEPELNFVSAGHGILAIGHRELAVRAGDLVYFHPGVEHELLECSADFGLLVFGMTPELSDRVLAGDDPARGQVLLHWSSSAAKAWCDELSNAHRFGRPRDRETRLGQLWRMAHRARRERPGVHVVTRRALATLADDPHMLRGALSERLRACPSEVSRTFQQETGHTLTEYRTRLRLMLAIERFDRGEANLMAISRDVGFGSYSQCHRAFVATFGCGPRTFFRSRRRTMADAFEPVSVVTHGQIVPGEEPMSLDRARDSPLGSSSRPR